MYQEPQDWSSSDDELQERPILTRIEDFDLSLMKEERTNRIQNEN